MSLDPRVVGKLAGDEEHYPEPYALAASSDGNGLTLLASRPSSSPARAAGRRYARGSDEGDEVIVGVAVVKGDETVIAVSRKRPRAPAATSPR